MSEVPLHAASSGDWLAIVCVVAIFLIGGLKLKTAEAKEALAAWQARPCVINLFE